MTKVRCYDCHRTYDYDKDAFCPHCGAFNQRPRNGQTMTLSDRLNGEDSGKRSYTPRVEKRNPSQMDDWLKQAEQIYDKKIAPFQTRKNASGVESTVNSRHQESSDKKETEAMSKLKIIRWLLIGFVALELLGGIFDYI